MLGIEMTRDSFIMLSVVGSNNSWLCGFTLKASPVCAAAPRLIVQDCGGLGQEIYRPGVALVSLPSMWCNGLVLSSTSWGYTEIVGCRRPGPRITTNRVAVNLNPPRLRLFDSDLHNCSGWR